MSKIAKNYAAFKAGVEHHDKMNPDHSAYGIGLSNFDMERLGFEEGEHVFGNITIQCDGKTSGNFRVLCDGNHDDAPQMEEQAQDSRVKVVSA
jgi:hypothetical protein